MLKRHLRRKSSKNTIPPIQACVSKLTFIIEMLARLADDLHRNGVLSALYSKIALIPNTVGNPTDFAETKSHISLFP
jgi:hypothetical protein